MREITDWGVFEKGNVMVKEMQTKLKLFLLSGLVSLVCFSCNNKYEKNIRDHFEKFVFIDNYKEYEINSIVAIDTLTEKKNKSNKVKGDIIELLNNIKILENAIEDKKNRINNIKYGKKWEIQGVTYYGKKSPYIGNMIIYDRLEGDYYNIGKEGLIKELQNGIIKDSILRNDFFVDVEKLKKHFNSIQKEQDGKILHIKFQVIIKGMRREGVDKIEFFVIQSPNGEIQSLLKR